MVEEPNSSSKGVVIIYGYRGEAVEFSDSGALNKRPVLLYSFKSDDQYSR